MSDPVVSEIENQLRSGAEDVLRSQVPPPPVAELSRRHAGRTRRRNRLRIMGLMIVFVLLPSAWIATVQLRMPVVERLPDELASNAPSHENLRSDALPSEDGGAERAPTIAKQDARPKFNAVPIVLVGTDTSGKEQYLPALYVPRRSELIKFDQLNKAQQRAVQAVLGKKVRSEMQKPI